MIKIRKQSAHHNFPKASIKVSIKITATVWTDIKIHLHCWYQASSKQPSRAKNETCENVHRSKRVTICHSSCLRWQARGKEITPQSINFWTNFKPSEHRKNKRNIPVWLTWVNRWIWNGQQASKQTNKTIQLSMIRDEKKTNKVNETKQSY